MIARACGDVVTLGSLVELVACFADKHQILTLGGPSAIKVITAVNLTVAGLMLSGMADHDRDWKRILIFGLGFLQVWLYGQYLQAGLMLSHEESLQSVLGMPSLGTVVVFMLSGLAGMSVAFNGRFARARSWIGASITLVAILGLIGYLSNEPFLYWQFNGVSTGIALPTLGMFSFLGVGMMALERRKKDSC